MTNEVYQQLLSRKYDPDYIPPLDFKTVTIKNKTVATLQNFLVLSGLPKTGKSLFLSAFIASALHPSEFFNIKINFPDNRRRICYIDTESSSYDFYRQMERIKKFISLNRMPENLDAFAVREDHHVKIMQYIEQYLLNTSECAVLVIDGLLDLIANFNSEEESKSLIQWIKRITKQYNCLIITVIHLGKKDNQTLGHLGSMADRYAQSTLLIEKDKEQQCFTLSSKFMRSDEDFDPISIKYMNGNYHEYNYQKSSEQEIKEKYKKKSGS